jgi:Flp pilus assembly protein TadG
VRRRDRPAERGQASLELALVLPFVLVVLLAVVQVGLVVRDQLLVLHATREAARAASVGDPDAQVERVARSAGPLTPSRLHVTITRRAGPDGAVDVEVDTRYRSVTDLPLVGVLVPDPELGARVVMRAE